MNTQNYIIILDTLLIMNRKTQTRKTDNRFLKESDKKVLGFNHLLKSDHKVGSVCDSIQSKTNKTLELIDNTNDINYKLRLKQIEESFKTRIDCMQAVLIGQWFKDHSHKSNEVLTQ